MDKFRIQKKWDMSDMHVKNFKFWMHEGSNIPEIDFFNHGFFVKLLIPPNWFFDHSFVKYVNF